MADFRKWLIAFAVVALLLGTGISANAQITVPQLACSATAGVTPLVRSQGLTELVGDIQIFCSGGTRAATGVSIPRYDIRVGLNTNITSRIYSSPAVSPVTGDKYTWTEGILMIDEPHPGSGGTATTPHPPTAPLTPNNNVVYNLCPYPDGCDVRGTPGGTSPYATGYNAFQGVLASGSTGVVSGAISGFNGIDFLGVPIDAPGTEGTRAIRITNIRGNASFLAAGSTVPNSIAVIAYVSIGGSQTIPLSNPQPTVAFVVNGLYESRSPFYAQQCVSSSGTAGVTVSEGFAYAFKPRIHAEAADGSGGDTQNVPGFSYYTESGFTAALHPADDPGTYGVADSGTRFIIRFANLQNGLSVSAPNVITNPSGTLTLLRVDGTDAYGGGGTLASYSAGGSHTISATYTGGTTANNDFVVYEVTTADPFNVESFTVPFSVSFTANPAGNVPYVTPPGTSNLLITAFTSSQFSGVAFAPSAPAGSTALPGTPQIEDGTGIGWIPRFVDQGITPSEFVTLAPCTCNLLFPYVTAGTGYDTGIAVANTSMDPFGGFSDAANTMPNDAGQSGALTFYFFGNNTSISGATNPSLFQIPPVAAAGTAGSAIVVPPGCVFAFDLVAGGGTPAQNLTGCGAVPTNPANFTINPNDVGTPTNGFTGYVIAVANFQYCHGLAYILPTTPGQAIGGMYLAIELDTPFWAQTLVPPSTRTLVYGESQGE